MNEYKALKKYIRSLDYGLLIIYSRVGISILLLINFIGLFINYDVFIDMGHIMYISLVVLFLIKLLNLYEPGVFVIFKGLKVKNVLKFEVFSLVLSIGSFASFSLYIVYYSNSNSYVFQILLGLMLTITPFTLFFKELVCVSKNQLTTIKKQNNIMISKKSKKLSSTNIIPILIIFISFVIFSVFPDLDENVTMSILVLVLGVIVIIFIYEVICLITYRKKYDLTI